MNTPNSPEFDKYWNLLSDRKWREVCVWRHVIITIVVLTLLIFLRMLLMLVVGVISYGHYPELERVVGDILFMPVVVSVIDITACLLANYSYWKHFEKPKEIVIHSNGDSVCYKVVHLDDHFPVPFPLRFSNTNYYTSFIFHPKQHILYVQHPQTNEIFGYCRNCHHLMKLEEVEESICPNCGKKIYYVGPH